MHQVNIEYLARVVFSRNGLAYPDTLVGTDSHTTMVNGLGVLGWGVGGIEAEAAMLGQPVSMLIPRVVGFKLSGELPDGSTATDLVLTITEMLRKHGVVGKFVEFYGPGVGAVPLANRATIGNMSPEYGSTAAMFPIDDETLRYLRFTGRKDDQIALVEAYAKQNNLWHDPSVEPAFSETLELDLSTVEPSLAGPKRPQDRVPLKSAKPMFREALGSYVESVQDGVDEANDESFPASDPSAPSAARATRRPAPSCAIGRRRAGRPTRSRSSFADGGKGVLDHGAVVIAAITSCTNTSNPSVMIGAALLAKKAVEKGLGRKPWVKTSLAPGSKVVTDYYDRAGLTPYLEKLGFNLVGYGCTTCIGNSGPIIEEVSAAVNEGDLAVTAVLSGNRNFEGRINPDVKMNYLASPPLVVAYALAGSMDVDLMNDPLGSGQRRQRRVPARHLAVAAGDPGDDRLGHRQRDVQQGLRGRLRRRRALAGPADAGGRHVRVGPRVDLRPQAPVLRGHGARPVAGDRHQRRARAAQARRLGDHRPHQPGRRDQGRLPRR